MALPDGTQAIDGGVSQVEGRPRLTKRGIEVYTIRGQVVVDRICRYENLSEELAFLEQRLGLPGPIEMPRAKAGHRRDRRHYRDVLSDEAASQIAQKFGREIELLGYTY